MSGLSNVYAVARREYLVRVRTRSFVLGTLALVLAIAAVAFVPVIVRYLEGTGGTKVAVWVGATDLPTEPVLTLDAMLNPPAADPGAGGQDPERGKDFLLRRVDDLDRARADVQAGQDAAVLAIERSAAGDLVFTIYTGPDPTTRIPQLIRQAASAIAIADRLARLGVTPGDQAGVFLPADLTLAWADPTRTDPYLSGADAGAAYLLGFGMTILIFMFIVLYGNWIAVSVVEEKASRVMEVILNAATPFQLLSGKVIGVGALALTQYVALLVTGIAALLAQGPVASALLDAAAAETALPAGLTVAALAVFGLYGVLGFFLYAVLYAATGSLVSRQEDVQQAVMPMALVSTAGYIIGVYAATGLLDMRSGWYSVIAQVPFFSPFLMLTRFTAGEAGAGEIALSVAILVVSIVVAMWIAARIYAVGVLMYGQRPGLRTIWRLLRQGM